MALGSLGLMAASLVLLVLDWKAIDSPITAQFSYFIGAAITGVLGLLITARRPRNPIGWLLLAIAVSDTVYVFADFVAIRGLLAGASASGWVEWPATVFNNSAGLGFLLLLFIVLFFPTGRLPGSRWRVAAWVVVAGAALSLIQGTTQPAPTQLSPRLPSVATRWRCRRSPARPATVFLRSSCTC